MLLQLKQIDVNCVSDDGDTPLHEAAFHGSAACVQQLLNAGANPTIRNKSGMTAQQLATDAECLAVFNRAR